MNKETIQAKDKTKRLVMLKPPFGFLDKRKLFSTKKVISVNDNQYQTLANVNLNLPITFFIIRTQVQIDKARKMLLMKFNNIFVKQRYNLYLAKR